MSGCCDEMGCRRTKPMMLMRSALTGVWYVVTDYRERGSHGLFWSKTRHRLRDDQQAQLNEMLADKAVADD